MSSQPKLRILLTRGEIEAGIDKLASKIRKDYLGKHPILICVLKGSFVFASDLVRRLNFPLDIDFVQLSSYGAGTESSGKIRVVHQLSSPIEGRHVLVIEDIVDTGTTIVFLMNYLHKKNPASLKLCALTSKPSRRKIEAPIDYLGFNVPDKFVVGYGLDFDEKFRNLPDICVLED